MKKSPEIMALQEALDPLCKIIPSGLPADFIAKVSSTLEGKVEQYLRLSVAQDANGMKQIIEKLQIVTQQIKSQLDSPQIVSPEAKVLVISLGMIELTRESVEKLILQDAQPPSGPVH